MSSAPSRRRAAPNPPDSFPRLHPDRPPEPEPEGPRNPLWDQIQAAADQLGRSRPARSRSKRHGFQPAARTHVETYFAHKVLGWSVRRLAVLSGRSLSSVHNSIVQGRQLVEHWSEVRGFIDSSGARLVLDRTDPDGWTQER